MNSGASRPPAVTGSITRDSSGMPTMAKPPPKAPFMKQIRKTAAKAMRMVVGFSSMLPATFVDIERGHRRPHASDLDGRTSIEEAGFASPLHKENFALTVFPGSA